MHLAAINHPLRLESSQTVGPKDQDLAQDFIRFHSTLNPTVAHVVYLADWTPLAQD